MAGDAAEAMSDQLRADLKMAMRERRQDEVRVLRSLIGAIDNAQAVPVAPGHQPYVAQAFGDGAAEVPRLVLSDADVARLLTEEASSREEAAEDMARLRQAERAALLRQEAAVVRRYL